MSLSSSIKIAAEESVCHPYLWPVKETPPQPVAAVVVRVYDKMRDKTAVVELERRCEAGKQGKPSVVTDIMDDPTARIANFPSRVMLVAEYGYNREIVGVIRGCIKTVTTGKHCNEFPVYVKLACVLGLRVSPAHRRLGIGAKLIQHLELWCKENGTDYAYMATDCSNQPSLNLFTVKSNYIKFRSPTVLVQPVHAHYKTLSSKTSLIRVPPDLAEPMYRRIFANSEFFPKDIDIILNNKLNLGTFMAIPKSVLSSWDPKLGTFPSSFAILSIWNAKEVFKLKVKGVSSLKYACSVGSRVLDSLLPCLRLPSIPDVFHHFGFYFLYGLHMEGNDGSSLMKSLCEYAHNLARDDRGIRILVAEVSQNDPVRDAIPHWKRFSWDDLWCIKELNAAKGRENSSKVEAEAWIRSRASVTFVDPRDL
ncbi:OLC1v1014557C1 [Oldenlandia corymbosa var. corymbosa]|uniref:OLC1v1014557C1 n=1 Tax=Oldenlandia corymbosa var. corymbosa TaxID=529605 RepID=A0AAV1E367_OLDCO|nr:OLC1v1014557C1 [Oldenlandia corymbosa var. corymbosa]